MCIMEYVSGEDATNNRHLAEAIEVTREGSAPVDGIHGYDEIQYPEGDVKTMRDSCFFVAIEELEKIGAAPTESREKIDQVLELLREARYDNDERRAQVMAQAHKTLQSVWVPPE